MSNQIKDGNSINFLEKVWLPLNPVYLLRNQIITSYPASFYTAHLPFSHLYFWHTGALFMGSFEQYVSKYG